MTPYLHCPFVTSPTQPRNGITAFQFPQSGFSSNRYQVPKSLVNIDTNSRLNEVNTTSHQLYCPRKKNRIVATISSPVKGRVVAVYQLDYAKPTNSRRHSNRVGLYYFYCIIYVIGVFWSLREKASRARRYRSLLYACAEPWRHFDNILISPFMHVNA